MPTKLCIKSVVLVSLSALSEGQVPDKVLHYADVVLFNGKIVSADQGFSVAQAVAVRDGKILEVGDNESVRKLAGPTTERVDLKGRTVLPGLVDTHSHLQDYALDHWGDDLRETEPRLKEMDQVTVQGKDLGEVQSKMKEIVGGKRPGEWLRVIIGGEDNIRSRFWNEIKMGHLDGIAPKNPLVVTSENLMINSRAVEEFRRVYGSEYHALEKDEKGQLTGRADRAVTRSIVADILLEHPVESLATVFEKELKEWTTIGITTWSTSLNSPWQLGAFTKLAREGRMPNRLAYTHALGHQSFPQGPGFYKRFGDMAGHGNDFLWNSGVSVVNVDSSYPAFCSSMKDVEPSTKLRERCQLSPGSFKREVMLAQVETGLRIAGVHVAGDQSVDYFLDVIEEGSRRGGLSLEEIRAKKHAIDHCAVNPRPDQIQRAQKLNVIWSCAPKYLTSIASRVEKDYGSRYAHEWVVPVRSILEAGGKAVIEIDEHEITETGPFHYMELLVTRKDRRGKVWGPHQAVDRKTALWMFTRWAAEYVMAEDRIGSLEPGKWADLIVLDRDFMAVSDDELSDIEVVKTMIQGRWVYEADASNRKEEIP